MLRRVQNRPRRSRLDQLLGRSIFQVVVTAHRSPSQTVALPIVGGARTARRSGNSDLAANTAVRHSWSVTRLSSSVKAATDLRSQQLPMVSNHVAKAKSPTRCILPRSLSMRRCTCASQIVPADARKNFWRCASGTMLVVYRSSIFGPARSESRQDFRRIATCRNS